MKRNRRGGTLVEVIITVVLAGMAIAPALSTMAQQVQSAQWARDRLIAVNLANELLELLNVQGARWIMDQLGYGVDPAFWPVGPPWLRYDATSGWSPVFSFGSGWANQVPCSLNPVLGGPKYGIAAAAGNYSNAIDQDFGNYMLATFSQVYHFRRRVEIFGGQNYTPPGLWTAANCVFVRVTISTDGNHTLAAPKDRYQVVTVIGDR